MSVPSLLDYLYKKLTTDPERTYASVPEFIEAAEVELKRNPPTFISYADTGQTIVLADTTKVSICRDPSANLPPGSMQPERPGSVHPITGTVR